MLGDATEEESRRFEERVFTDDDFKTHALIVEDELFEDYAARLLPADEREKFERHVLRTPASREKLNIVSAMQTRRDPAPTSQQANPLPQVHSGRRFNWLKFPSLSPARMAAALAMLLLILSAGGLWYVFRDGPHRPDTTRRERLEAEIDALNRQGIQPSASRPDLLVVQLTSGQIRGDGEQTKLILPASDLTVRFRLTVPPGRGAQGLGVILLNGEHVEVFSYDRLTVRNSDDRTEVMLDVPAHALTPDDYVLKLRDLSANRDVAGGDYSFRVVRP
ncbi:MAG TPA: hypothetical protein VGB05_05345 [Pyrinomonadaceae bacterium]